MTFVGTIPMVEEVLLGCDLFLFTSETESFGLAILEAMASGVPVVATAVGGVPEVMVDGETGFLHPVGDIEGMAASAARILRDGRGDAGSRFGAAARRRAVEHFAQSDQVERYRRIYQRVLAQANGERPGLRPRSRRRARRQPSLKTLTSGGPMAEAKTTAAASGEAAALGHRVPAGEARAELREKGSRFLAVVGPAADETAAQAFVERLRGEHPDATHHCYAWRVGERPDERAADAGEPSGTAGPPILAALRGRELRDVVAVVVRWFGGVKLGKGGLVRAYGGAARAALDALPVARRVPRLAVELALGYEQLGAVMRLVHPPQVELAGERYADGVVHLTLGVRADQRRAVAAELADLGLTDTVLDAAPEARRGGRGGRGGLRRLIARRRRILSPAAAFR